MSVNRIVQVRRRDAASARKEAAIHEAITRRESQMTCDNEAIVRHAYHTAEGNVQDIPGWVGSFTEDGVFNNVRSDDR